MSLTGNVISTRLKEIAAMGWELCDLDGGIDEVTKRVPSTAARVRGYRAFAL